MCDYTKDIKFIEKRISEQIKYNKDLFDKATFGEISVVRYDEVYKSAIQQYHYFKDLKEQYYESEKKLPTIHE